MLARKYPTWAVVDEIDASAKGNGVIMSARF